MKAQIPNAAGPFVSHGVPVPFLFVVVFNENPSNRALIGPEVERSQLQ